MSDIRQFNATFAELVDKLTVDQIKEALLPEERAKEYASEIKLLEHDIDLILSEKEIKFSAEFVRMITLLAQSNLHVWYIKDKMMAEPEDYIEQLRFAQDINGIRNHIKNLILKATGEATAAAERVTFLNYKDKKWYTEMLKNLEIKNMEILDLKIEDFAAILKTTPEDFPSQCKSIIEEKNFKYRKMEQDERDNLLLKIIKRIESGKLSVSGAHRKPDWEFGWSENLKEYEKNRDVFALTPKFIKPDRPIRMNGDYIVPSSDRFEFDFVDVLRRWLFDKYFKDKSTIYEFGCGSCQHLGVLAEMFPGKKIVGTDWVPSSIKIIDKLVEFNGWNMEGKLFDLFDPDKEFKLEEGSVVFTVGTMEQLGRDFEPFLQYLLSNPVGLCLHMETTKEFYDDNNLVDHLALEFDAKRGYLDGFLTRLKELEKEGRIEILRAQKIPFGSLYHDSYSLTVWKPVK